MKSTHRGKEVYHYYDLKTNLNVAVNQSNNKFISDWSFSVEQIINMKKNGNIQ